MISVDVQKSILKLRVNTLCRIAERNGLKPDQEVVVPIAEYLCDAKTMTEIRRLYRKKSHFFDWIRKLVQR